MERYKGFFSGGTDYYNEEYVASLVKVMICAGAGDVRKKNSFYAFKTPNSGPLGLWASGPLGL